MRYHMRRTDKEMKDEPAMKEILKSTKYVTLAMSKENVPYLVSLSHGYDEGRNAIYFHCAGEGKKLDYLRANNLVWGQTIVDYGYAEGECSHYYATIMFSGRVSFIEDPDEKWHALSLMTRQLDSDPETLISNRKPESLTGTVVARIDIEHISGKRSPEIEE